MLNILVSPVGPVDPGSVDTGPVDHGPLILVLLILVLLILVLLILILLILVLLIIVLLILVLLIIVLLILVLLILVMLILVLLIQVHVYWLYLISLHQERLLYSQTFFKDSIHFFFSDMNHLSPPILVTALSPNQLVSVLLLKLFPASRSQPQKVMTSTP